MGQIFEVLVEDVNDQDENMISGRLSNNLIVHFKGDKSLIGKLINVHLDESKGFYYIGTVKG